MLVLQGTQDLVSPATTIAEVIAEMDATGNDVRFERAAAVEQAVSKRRARGLTLVVAGGGSPNGRAKALRT